MSEPTEKKPTEEKKSPAEEKNSTETIRVNRDKNGCFTSNKKADDGSVKIKVVKEARKTDKKRKSSKPEEDKAEQESKTNGYVFYYTKKIPAIPIPRIPGMPRPWLRYMHHFLDSIFTEENKSPKLTARDFAQYVSDKSPDSLSFNDKKYYSEQFVSKIVGATIAQCAEKAVEDEERAKKAAEEQKHIAEAQKELRRKLRVHRIAFKLAKIFSNILSGIIIFGLVCGAAFGLAGFGRILFK